jgi:hypothetical protein
VDIVQDQTSANPDSFIDQPMAGSDPGNAIERGVHAFQSRAGAGAQPRRLRDQVIEHLEDFLSASGRSSRWAAHPRAGRGAK